MWHAHAVYLGYALLNHTFLELSEIIESEIVCSFQS